MFILTCKIAKTLYSVLGTDNYMRKKKQFFNNKIFPSIDKTMLLVCMMNGNYYLIFFPFISTKQEKHIRIKHFIIFYGFLISYFYVVLLMMMIGLRPEQKKSYYVENGKKSIKASK